MLEPESAPRAHGAVPARLRGARTRRVRRCCRSRPRFPRARVTTAELAERLGVSEDWIVSRTGIRERPVAGAGRAAV